MLTLLHVGSQCVYYSLTVLCLLDLCCVVQQHYAQQQQQQQHSSYAAPGSYVHPAPMGAAAYAAQPAAYAAAPIYPPQQQPGYGERVSCLQKSTLSGNTQPSGRYLDLLCRLALSATSLHHLTVGQAKYDYVAVPKQCMYA